MTEMAASPAGSASGGKGYTPEEELGIVRKIEEIVVLNNHEIPAEIAAEIAAQAAAQAADAAPRRAWGVIGDAIKSVANKVAAAGASAGTTLQDFLASFGQGNLWDDTEAERIEKLRTVLHAIVKDGVQTANSLGYKVFVVLPTGAITVNASDSVIFLPYNQDNVYNLLVISPDPARRGPNEVHFNVVKSEENDIPGIIVTQQTRGYRVFHYSAPPDKTEYGSPTVDLDLHGKITKYGSAAGVRVPVSKDKPAPTASRPASNQVAEPYDPEFDWGLSGDSGRSSSPASTPSSTEAHARAIENARPAAYMALPANPPRGKVAPTPVYTVTSGSGRSVYSPREPAPPSKNLGARVQKVINVLEKFRGRPFNEENKKTVAQLAPTMLPGLDGKQAMGGDLKTQVTRFITALNRMMKWKLTARDADALITGLTQLVEKYGN